MTISDLKKKKALKDITRIIWILLVLRRHMVNHLGVRGLNVYNLLSNDSSKTMYVYIHILTKKKQKANVAKC